MNDGIHPFLQTLGFTRLEYVKDRVTIADLFRPRRRCGLYVLHFADGWCYAGKAVDVVRRYAQHRHTHSDIEQLSFRPLARSRLNDEEKLLIESLERNGEKLRNITLVSSPQAAGGTDFDLIMTPHDQERWLESTQVSFGSDGRISDPSLRFRYHARFERFMKLRYTERVLPVLRSYVQASIPVIRDSEMSFWVSTCVPSYSRTDLTIYSRINIFWQEVFNVSAAPLGPLWFSWHLALAPLEQRFGKGARRLIRRYPFVELFDHRYQPGGQDQIEMSARGSRNALQVIQDPDVLRAVREFNLRLARKGPCTFSRYHCFDLADHLVGDL